MGYVIKYLNLLILSLVLASTFVFAAGNSEWDCNLAEDGETWDCSTSIDKVQATQKKPTKAPSATVTIKPESKPTTPKNTPETTISGIPSTIPRVRLAQEITPKPAVEKTTEIVKKGNDYFEVAQMYNDAPDETNNKWFVKVADNGEFSSYTVEQPTPNKLQFEHFTLTSSFSSQNRGLNLITDDAQNNDKKGFRIYADIDASINLLDTFRFCQDEVIQFSLNESEKRGSIEVFQQHKNILGSEGPGDFCEVHNASFLSDWERVPVQFNVFTPLKYASHERTEFEELSMEKFQEIIKSECDDYHFSLVQNYEQLEQIKQHVILKEIILKIIFTDFTTGEKHEERIIYDIQFR